ncbi:hypothetical protein CWE09_04445 [Aliidiomarina minuta]|uniref:Endonuclease/exonuclease/phosphatase domain-containing protein n=1 Tax=Aliidiomarina minuta TaxID=880057 RepID=A0A432W7C5_9GAMM|nr:ExeM/NucH family extracellular endonuclease [Aliidiomarina minuta]RUO25983.1 hypothetical protein CWE09_04445 [Aliidiomarina minuta]
MKFKPGVFTLVSACSFFLVACNVQESGNQLAAAQCDADTASFADLGEYSNQQVILQGTVSGDFQGESALNGFFLQNTTAAAFIEDHEFIGNLSEGQKIQVKGRVSDYYGGWQLSDISGFIDCGSDEVAVRPLSLPLSDTDSLSQYLLQRVRLDQDMVVIGHYQLARFGTLDIATEPLWVPTQVEQPGADAARRSAYNEARRLVLDDGSWQENPAHIPYPTGGLSMDNPVRSGDQVSSVEGILLRIGNNYHIQPTVTPEFTASNPRRDVPELADGDLRVVAFNVLNYFNGDGQGGGFPTPRGAENIQEFERQRAKTIAAMIAMDADIYALMEMENDGFDEYSALADLTRGLNNASDEVVFSYAHSDAETVGGDAITQAIVYRHDRVTPVGDLTWTEEGPFSWGSRPPLLQNFKVLSSGKEVAVVANHFKSKGSCPDDRTDENANQNDGQACWNELRVATAQALLDWLADNPKEFAHTNYIVLGDFNAYQNEDPLVVLSEGGFTNVADHFDREGYSYVFRGERGSLDHVLVHDSIWDAVQDMAHWYINADEPIAFEYPLSDKTAEQQQRLYAPTPYRSSDHDPIITVIDSTALH